MDGCKTRQAGNDEVLAFAELKEVQKLARKILPAVLMGNPLVWQVGAEIAIHKAINLAMTTANKMREKELQQKEDLERSLNEEFQKSQTVKRFNKEFQKSLTEEPTNADDDRGVPQKGF